MDLMTHALLGAAIAPNAELAVPMAITSTIPDWWNIPPLVEFLWRKRGRYNNTEYWQWIPDRYTELTRWSHSILPLVFAFGIGGGVFRVSPWIFLPWLLHLVIDIPTHATSRTGYLLYPLSRWQPLGAKNWYHMRWLSYLSILVLGIIVWLRFGHF